MPPQLEQNRQARQAEKTMAEYQRTALVLRALKDVMDAPTENRVEVLTGYQNSGILPVDDLTNMRSLERAYETCVGEFLRSSRLAYLERLRLIAATRQLPQYFADSGEKCDTIEEERIEALRRQFENAAKQTKRKQ